MSYGYIDCHCHLAAPEFEDDLHDVIQQAKDSNVKAIIVVPEFFSEFERILKICNDHQNFLLPCLGIHPVQVSYISVYCFILLCNSKCKGKYNEYQWFVILQNGSMSVLSTIFSYNMLMLKNIETGISCHVCKITIYFLSNW